MKGRGQKVTALKITFFESDMYAEYTFTKEDLSKRFFEVFTGDKH